MADSDDMGFFKTTLLIAWNYEVQLVSYKSTLRADSKNCVILRRLLTPRKPTSILFAGHTLVSDSDVNELNKLVDNDKTTAVLK
jgi:hypothetical protein